MFGGQGETGEDTGEIKIFFCFSFGFSGEILVEELEGEDKPGG